MSLLRAFDAYGQTGKVRRAAALLGVSHPIISRHLRGLEEWLGVMLIDRERGMLTPVGEDYHARIQLSLDQIGLATDRIRGGAGSRLTIWCVPGFAYLWLTARLPAFSALHPSTALDLRPTDAPADLGHRQADADIRWIRDAERKANADRASIDIVRPRVFPVARPDAPWLQNAVISHPEHILKMPLLHEGSDDDWRDWCGANALGDISPPVYARLWQAPMTLAAACEGQGVALTNNFLASDHLAAGRLVELGSESPTFRPVTVGAYRFTARPENWDAGPAMWFRNWLLSAVADCPSSWSAT